MSFGRVRAALLIVAFMLCAGWPGRAFAAEPVMRVFAQRAFGVESDLRERKVDDVVVIEAWRGPAYIGSVFSTWDIVRSVGYSGQPIDIWVALDASSSVVSARLVRQTEPLLVIGVSPEQLEALVAGLSGLNIRDLSRARTSDGKPPMERIAGATISSNVLRDSVIRAARKVARETGRGGEAGRLRRDLFEETDWRGLLASRAVVERKIYQKDIDPASVRTAGPDEPVLDVFVALATPAGIGVNLLGRRLYENLVSGAGPDDDLVFVGANGLLSIKGSSWRQTGVFERLAIVQDQTTIRLTREMHRSFDKLAADGAPELRERAIFVLPAGSGLDHTRPWRLQILATQTDAQGRSAGGLVDAPYDIPRTFVVEPKPEEPAWVAGWRARIPDVAAVCAMLGALVLILMFQDQFAASRLYRPVRIVFMAVTLVFLGFYERAQLSVVHVVTFVQALRTDFQWSLFLLDPIIFILWGFVAVAMIFWGRGVFCGWLCPFGALQELLNEIARRLRIRQVDLPWGLHERLWILKYLVFLGIFALSLNSMELGFTAAEAEPFKTAVALRFQRAWPFVAFAVLLLFMGLFVRRAYCRYLCPLGAALALPARMRIFEWLKRRPQCGRECRQCAAQCPVGAIYPSGAISPNECIYCLNCQSLYHDPNVCLGLKAREARRRGREAMTAAGSASNG